MQDKKHKIEHGKIKKSHVCVDNENEKEKKRKIN
jgi:hypothetical protein